MHTYAGGFACGIEALDHVFKARLAVHIEDLAVVICRDAAHAVVHRG